MAGQVSLDDYTRLRLKRAGLHPPGTEAQGSETPAFVGRVISPGSRIAVGQFLLVQPAVVLGDESEGSPGTLAPGGLDPVPVYLVGPGKPATGDYLVCRHVDYRWAAERTVLKKSGGDTGTIPNCACPSIPLNLKMTSADPTCNYRMFQSCTILGGPTPAQFAGLNLGPSTFISTESFPDPVANGAMFWYYLTCQYNQFFLTRFYLESPFGSPYRDGILYTWLVGGYGNTCDPFRLDGGLAFPGSDLSCSVTIEAA